MAATYSEKNGFMFCTWKQNADGDSVFWGDYSPNYEYWNTIFLYRSRRQICCFGKPPSVKCRQRNCLRKLSKNI